MPKTPKNILAITGLPKTTYKFVIEARDELKKVAWPSRQATIRYTIIVVIVSLVTGLFIGGIDLLFQLVLEKII